MNMLSRLLSLLAIFFFTNYNCSFAEGKLENIVASVDGIPISSLDISERIKAFNLSGEEGKRIAFESIVDDLLLVRESMALGISYDNNRVNMFAESIASNFGSEISDTIFLKAKASVIAEALFMKTNIYEAVVSDGDVDEFIEKEIDRETEMLFAVLDKPTDNRASVVCKAMYGKFLVLKKKDMNNNAKTAFNLALEDKVFLNNDGSALAYCGLGAYPNDLDRSIAYDTLSKIRASASINRHLKDLRAKYVIYKKQ